MKATAQQQEGPAGLASQVTTLGPGPAGGRVLLLLHSRWYTLVPLCFGLAILPEPALRHWHSVAGRVAIRLQTRQAPPRPVCVFLCNSDSIKSTPTYQRSRHSLVSLSVACPAPAMRSCTAPQHPASHVCQWTLSLLVLALLLAQAAATKQVRIQRLGARPRRRAAGWRCSIVPASCLRLARRRAAGLRYTIAASFFPRLACRRR